jgi:predicted O-methyltransferase YrrM
MYVFSENFIEPFTTNCNRYFQHLRDGPTRYLEIGVLEGRSGCWMLDEILIHPDSEYHGIDIEVLNVARKNLGVHGNKVHLYQGDANDVLKTLIGKGQFDLIYIDGDHTAMGVYRNSILCLPLAKRYILWDDVYHNEYQVREGLEKFLAMVAQKNYTMYFKNFQWCIEVNQTA